MPSPAVEATCDGAAAVPRAGKPCGKAGSMSRLCSKGSILPLDFLSTKLVINSQAAALIFYAIRKRRRLCQSCIVWAYFAVTLIFSHRREQSYDKDTFR